MGGEISYATTLGVIGYCVLPQLLLLLVRFSGVFFWPFRVRMRFFMPAHTHLCITLRFASPLAGGYCLGRYFVWYAACYVIAAANDDLFPDAATVYLL